MGDLGSQGESPGELGGLSSMISWVVRGLVTRFVWMARAGSGVVRAALARFDDERGADADEKRGVAWNWCGLAACCKVGVWP